MWCSTRPAAVTTMEGGTYRDRYQPITSSRVRTSIDSTLPSTERPSVVAPNRVSEKEVVHRVCGLVVAHGDLLEHDRALRLHVRGGVARSVTRSDGGVAASGRSLAGGCA